MNTASNVCRLPTLGAGRKPTDTNTLLSAENRLLRHRIRLRDRQLEEISNLITGNQSNTPEAQQRAVDILSMLKRTRG